MPVASPSTTTSSASCTVSAETPALAASMTMQATSVRHIDAYLEGARVAVAVYEEESRAAGEPRRAGEVDRARRAGQHVDEHRRVVGVAVGGLANREVRDAQVAIAVVACTEHDRVAVRSRAPCERRVLRGRA